MKKKDKIFIAGHTGLAGSALLKLLQKTGYSAVITADRNALDLADESAVFTFLKSTKPDHVFMCAGRSGGISSNISYPAEHIYENLKIQQNLIHGSYLAGVKKLLFIGCSCLYPAKCPQPAKEEYLLTGPFEKTNEPFSAAKLAGLMMCRAYNAQYKTNFITCIPDSLYGPNDNFNAENSHVIPSLIRKFHEAISGGKNVISIWGSGKPVRGFMHADDFADACLFLMRNYNSSEPVNVSLGRDASISEVADTLKGITGFNGILRFDKSRPDGVIYKSLDNSKLSFLGWKPGIELKKGLADTYSWYIKHANNAV